MLPSRLLRRLLLRARGTAFGRAHDFAGAARERDVWAVFRARVPPQSFDSLAPWLARTHAGEADVLWPGVLRRFAVSGGTTGTTTGATGAPAKLLPRSDAHLRLDVRFSRRAARPLLLLVLRGLPSARVLALPGQIGPDPARPDALTGEVSGLVAHAAPVWARAVQAVAPSALDDSGPDLLGWETRMEQAVEIALAQDVRLLVLVPSWAPVLFDLVRAAHRRRTGRTATTLRDVWPRLGGVVTGGVALASYRAAMEAMMGNDDRTVRGAAHRPGGPAPVRFIETYGASEGFFAYQTGDAHDADGSMALDTDSGVAFEFVPAERAVGGIVEADAPRLTVDAVEVGRRYVPLVSTASGLWAYAVGDVVRFTQAGPAPRIVVVGRTREVLDRYGEAVYADEAAAALGAATREAGVAALHWHVGADGRGARPRHRWVVSLAASADREGGRTGADPRALAAALDAHLRAANRHYAIRRASGAMAPPDVILVPEVAFRRYLVAARARVGAQSKVPRLRDDSEIVDALVREA